MKFEKHLKNCGIMTCVFRATSGDLYVAAGFGGSVLMRCPEAFKPVSGAEIRPLPDWIEDYLLSGVEDLHEGELFAAEIDKEGKASDIVRVFADQKATRRVKISNANFGLIERRDLIRLFDPELDQIEGFGDNESITGALVVVDRDNRIAGIVLGL